jgi:hypothetical protein
MLGKGLKDGSDCLAGSSRAVASVDTPRISDTSRGNRDSETQAIYRREGGDGAACRARVATSCCGKTRDESNGHLLINPSIRSFQTAQAFD